VSDAPKRHFWGTVRELFVDVRTLVGLMVGLVALGAAGVVRLDGHTTDTARAAVEPELARQRIRIEAVEARTQRAQSDVAELRDDVREVRDEQRAVRADLRLMARGRPLPPLPALDGGVP